MSVPSGAPGPGGAAAVIAAQLAGSGIAHTVHRHVAVATIDEALARVPHLTEDLLKTVVFEIAGSARRLLVAVDCAARVDYRGVAAAAGCSRRALRLVPPERVAAELGFEIGGVGPFRVAPGVEVVLDAGSAPARRVRVGGGLRTLTIELAFGDLAALGEATLAAVARTDAAPA